MEELDEVVDLLRKYLGGKLTEPERERLERWSAQHPANRALLESLSDEESLFAGYADYSAMYDESVSNRIRRIEDTLMESITHDSRPKRRILQWLPYAAAILLVALAGTWFFYGGGGGSPDVKVERIADIPPGGNRATLTLADGRTISLDEVRDGIIISGGEITYNDGNPLAEVDEKDGTAFFELSTPKGGTYRVTLSDGTTVWLNAASTLKYPNRFTGNERTVALVGEAYFEVSKGAPFKVISRGQTVEVLGTQFNVSAYADEQQVQTTLVEGVVQIAAENQPEVMQLQPGEQSTLTATHLEKSRVSVASVVSWKEGLFSFHETELRKVMNQLSRWYDVKVEYQGTIPPTFYYGAISRKETLSVVLDLLRQSGLNFRIDKTTGINKVIVLP